MGHYIDNLCSNLDNKVLTVVYIFIYFQGHMKSARKTFRIVIPNIPRRCDNEDIE